MGDMISRVALLDEFRSLCGPQTGDGWDNMGVRNLIMRQKTVDAAPVKRGRWIYFNCVGNGRYQCSECFHWVDAGSDRNYCPNCGAKMDGDANG